MLDDGEPALPGGSAEAGVAKTRMLDDGERAPPGGSAKAGAAKARVLDDGERAQPGSSSEAGAAATGMLGDGERAPPGGSAFATKTDDDTKIPDERQLVHTAYSCSRNRFHDCIDLSSLDRGSGLYSPLSSRDGPAHQS